MRMTSLSELHNWLSGCACAGDLPLTSASIIFVRLTHGYMYIRNYILQLNNGTYSVTVVSEITSYRLKSSGMPVHSLLTAIAVA